MGFDPCVVSPALQDGPLTTWPLRPSVACLLASRPSNMLVYLRDGSVQTFMCCHTEIEVADQTFYLTQSQYPDTWLTSSSADPIMPGA